ncbi:glutathionylspermidine synthase family protein [Corynebacterium variabile]|uniref:glutathionylspermidine synthase family protein n=1 Tax=Corynebacterium variabile TaxID=1727 RepID=UPI0028B2145A|nr:glutathionylspermidine synthase family protein [Corynebacterium variabile]
MERITCTPREGWEEIIRSQGLTYSHSVRDAGPDAGTEVEYWNESAAYVFTLAEVEALEVQTENLHRMALEAARFLADEQWTPGSPWRCLGLPEYAVEYAVNSLNRGDPDLYGRFDLAYSGVPGEPAKMLEYNADTPTGIVETAISQWYWYEDKYGRERDGGAWDQWNFLFEALRDRFAALRLRLPGGGMHFAHTELERTGEDIMNTAVLRDCADQAGWNTTSLLMSEIGWDARLEEFVDMDDQPIQNIFKLYPWEDMMGEEFGCLLATKRPTGWIEPAWKMFLSTKVLGAAMWHLYPGHENLLPSYIDGPREMTDWVKKPLHGREGDNIEIFRAGTGSGRGEHIVQPGRYGPEGYVWQQYTQIPNFPGPDGAPNHPVLGAWVVNGESVGVGIRESDGPVTDYWCRFVPNLIHG